LPIGLHQATLREVIDRLGSDSEWRKEIGARLQRIYHLAKSTGALDRFLIYGSFVTAKPEPNDVDVVLMMKDQFRTDDLQGDVRILLDHQRATQILGASIFWIRPGMLIGITLDDFVINWQTKRDGTKRGIVEVVET